MRSVDRREPEPDPEPGSGPNGPLCSATLARIANPDPNMACSPTIPLNRPPISDCTKVPLPAGTKFKGLTVKSTYTYHRNEEVWTQILFKVTESECKSIFETHVIPPSAVHPSNEMISTSYIRHSSTGEASGHAPS